MAMQGIIACTVFVGEVNALAVVVLAGGGHGTMAMRETVACDAAVRKANARAVAAQEMLPLAVALRNVFLVFVAAQEIVAAKGRWGRWGRTDATAVDSEWYARRPSSGRKRSTALNPAAPPAVALGMGSLNHTVGRSGALVSSLVDGRKL